LADLAYRLKEGVRHDIILKSISDHKKVILKTKYLILENETKSNLLYDDFQTKMSSSSSASPVHIVTPSTVLDDQDKPPISLQSKNLLKDLLHPLDPNHFMVNDFRRNAVHIQSREHDTHKNKKDFSGPNRYQPIIEEGMFHLETSELVRESSSDSVFVWLTAKKKVPGDNGEKDSRPTLVQSIELSDADTALALHESTGGHALYCRAPPPVEQVLVSKLLADTGLGCGQYDPSGESMTSLARGEVEMFITSKSGGITDWHYDFQENFTLQLSGVKRWTLQRGTVKHPLRACTPHYKAPDVVENQIKAARLSAPDFIFDQPKSRQQHAGKYQKGFNAEGPIETITLYPGDAFYFPAGMWHKIEVLEPGVSINISLMAANYASITCQALQHYLLKRDEWRQVLVHNPRADAFASASENGANPNGALDALKHLKRLLRDLPEIIAGFEKTCGGAESILPPVLQQAPNFHTNEDTDEAEGTKRPEKKARHNEENDEVNGSDDDSDNDSNDKEWENVDVEEEDDEDKIIDAREFQYSCLPSHIASTVFDDESQTLSSEIIIRRLVRNPLATLIRMNDVTRYYARFEGTEEDEGISNECDLFVLNVNYAGVESHESTVRVVLRDTTGKECLDHISRPGSDPSILCREPEVLCNLLYYGFYTLLPLDND